MPIEKKDHRLTIRIKTITKESLSWLNEQSPTFKGKSQSDIIEELIQEAIYFQKQITKS